MPRGGRSSGRSSGFGSSSRSASPNRSAQSTYTRPPQQAQQTMQPPVQSGGMMGGLGSTIMTGMALGAGSAVGHQVVRSMFGGNSEKQEQHVEQQQPIQQTQETQNYNTNACQEFNTKFVDCLKFSNNDIAQCQNIFNELKSCQSKLI